MATDWPAVGSVRNEMLVDDMLDDACRGGGFTAVSAASTYDDAAVSRQFLRTTGYFCGNGDPVGSSLKWILETCCGGDTNRYVRIAKETATSNANFANMAIAVVKKHGCAADLPFLYQYTNNAECARSALTGILQLGGLTDSSVAAASAYISGTNTYYAMDRNDVACELFRCSANSLVPGELRDRASNIALDFARNSDNVRYNDIGFRASDPSYKYSKRRLSVLRSVLPLCQGYEILMNYTTNAINELVAYPESALPD